jgi:hypothetical protein
MDRTYRKCNTRHYNNHSSKKHNKPITIRPGVICYDFYNKLYSHLPYHYDYYDDLLLFHRFIFSSLSKESTKDNVKKIVII